MLLNSVSIQEIFFLFGSELFVLFGSFIIILHNMFYRTRSEEIQIQLTKKTNYILILLLLVVLIYQISEYYYGIWSFNNFFELTSSVSIIKIVVTFFLLVYLGVCSKYLLEERLYNFEFFLLILFAYIGMSLLLMSRDLISVYLSVEIISLSSYVLATIKRFSEYSTEAGLKYFALGVFGSAFLLLASALIYGLLGTTNLIQLGLLLPFVINSSLGISVLLSVVLFVVAFLFKLGIVPFHMWVPDVYEGSPTIVTMFFSIFPKIVFFTFIYLLFKNNFSAIYSNISSMLIFFGLTSITIGTLFAIYQERIKRLLAYSSIVHAGYLLLSLSTSTLQGSESYFLYLFFYVLMIFNVFSVILSLRTSNTGVRLKYITELRNISKSNPLLSINLALILFSMAGIPPLSGFFSKYYVFDSVLASGYIVAAFLGLIVSIVGALYYIYLVRVMYFDKSNYTLSLARISVVNAYIISVTFFITLFAFLYMSPLLTFCYNLSILNI